MIRFFSSQYPQGTGSRQYRFDVNISLQKPHSRNGESITTKARVGLRYGSADKLEDTAVAIAVDDETGTMYLVPVKNLSAEELKDVRTYTIHKYKTASYIATMDPAMVKFIEDNNLTGLHNLEYRPDGRGFAII